MQEDPSPIEPFGNEQQDAFVEHVDDDPEVKDIFGNRARPAGNQMEPLPDATAVLILGILSILGGFCYGITGVVVGLISIIMSAKPERQYQLDPQRYTITSYNNVKAGKVCAIIGLCLSLIMSFFFLLVFLNG